MTTFHKPRSVAQALALLRELPEATLLSGGQTLVPMINIGLVQPAAIVSLTGIESLRGVQRAADGSVRIGALTRHAEVAESPSLVDGQAVLRQAGQRIGNVAVRTNGTIGGACAHGDPSTNWPAALVAADAAIELTSEGGTRQVPAYDFFQGFLSTALAPGELVTAILVPRLPGRGAYCKHVHVAGGGSVLSVGVVAESDAGVLRSLRVAVGAMGPRPLRLPDAERTLVAERPDAEAVQRFAQALAARAEPDSDVHGSADYKRRILPGIVVRTIHECMDHA